MASLKSYNEELKKRVELVREAYNERAIRNDFEPQKKIDFLISNLLDYLEGLSYFVEEEEKKTCDICHNPLYKRQDGSLVCVEMKH